ncbi:hypothetical protein GGR56DRAFT_613295 [Xylariaceae sp. FL0804]|nr:hypothetical protein GGR56DRAFT_613295 [Xylariaceae sp. FL0804]
MASRYSGSRYDGDSRRSRSRDRSPDRRSLYSDGGPRRSSAESRSNSTAFQTNRDSFLPRDTPRGPKALLDAPSGPRGGGYSGDFRGRGRGRGRGWRDDSRDRGRDRDIDFRDRNSYRDERSRERDRGDWRDRERDSFRGRRPSPRGRSPPGRDFLDLRDRPLNVDAERARRGSRDGPLSAGSSSSDPPFAHSSYRGGYSGRGRGRGRGDWDRSRGRGFDYDRDRYGPSFRSRSQEGRYRPDRDDRDRADIRPRDPRDDRDRSKLDRTSHEPPPSTKDVSPPPVAPAAPSFGSVPNRTTTATDIGSVAGKAPPTGPRALKDDRTGPIAASPTIETRLPPTGPSKPSFHERSPPIPSGPRSTRPGPSSKQWINPNLKNRVPESPKLGRSQSFAQPRPASFRPESNQNDHLGDSSQRPYISDGQPEPQLASSDVQSRDSRAVEPRDDPATSEKRPQSAGTGSYLDPDSKQRDEPSLVKSETTIVESTSGPLTEAPSIVKIGSPSPRTKAKLIPTRRAWRKVPIIRLSEPEKQTKQPIIDQSSESDDEEFGDVIESEMGEVERRLKQFEGIGEVVPMDTVVRHATVSVSAVARVVAEEEGLEGMVGDLLNDVDLSNKKLAKIDAKTEEQPPPAAVPIHEEVTPTTKTTTASPKTSGEPAQVPTLRAELPQPSIEQDAELPATVEPQGDAKKPDSDDKDVPMEDVPGSQPDSEVQAPHTEQGLASGRQSLYPQFEEAQIQSGGPSKRGSSTPSPPEDDDETDVEDVDLQTIEIVREHMATPPLDSLPYFDEKPWFKDPGFAKSMDVIQPDLSGFIMNRLKEDAYNLDLQETGLRKQYGDNYEAYLRFTMSSDPVAVKSREKFTFVPGAPEIVTQKPGLTETKPESTRRSRYASERDLERILEESRRVEDEKRERQLQAERERYRTDKEAVLPSQYQTLQERENDLYGDSTGLVQAEKIVATWEVLPPRDNFSEDEVAVFEKAYLEFPKQWGRVSEPLEKRDFGTSIQFYYLKKEKEELNLKEKLKKQPKKRKRGRGKQRSSALVSELGNGDNDTEETQETGDNGERRRPRRAAAPTFNSEATPATDAEGATPAGTPGRRGGAAAKTAEGGGDKTERRRGRRGAKDKEPKQTRVNQALAAAPPTGTGARGGRSRSNSRAQGADWITQQTQVDNARIPSQYELGPGTTAPMPPLSMQAPFQTAPSLLTPDRGIPAAPPGSLSDVMAPPPLRPEPIPQPQVAMMEALRPAERKSGPQPSSYWSVPEAGEFPHLLRSFGSDWAAIAGHMQTKTAVMVKNYYARRKDSNDWEALVQEADARRLRGEKRPPPPAPMATVNKKRYPDTSSNRPLAAADATMEEAPPQPKVEAPAGSQMMGRFNVPIAAHPHQTAVQTPFSQAPQQPPPLVQGHAPSQPIPQSLAQPISQTMSPSAHPLRAPLPFSEREPFLQQPSRTPLVQKAPGQAQAVAEPSVRHPLPGSMAETQAERHRVDMKPLKEAVRQAERPPMHVKQEPDLHHHVDLFAAQPHSGRMSAPRPENQPPSRPPEPPRAVAPAPQAPFATVLQQQPGRGLFGDAIPSPPAPPRPLSTMSRPMSGTNSAEPYSAPPAQRTPPAVVPMPARPTERKTSNLMALLNDDPPPPPKRVAEVPAAPKASSTPPPQSHHSRPPPPPPPPPPTQLRRESSMADSQPYGYGRNPPQAPSSIPSLKPYTASPQPQPLGTPRHMPMETAAERDYYGSRGRAFSSAQHQGPPAGSPQSGHHYPPPGQHGQMAYPPHQAPYPYGAQVQPQPPSAASPPPQYAAHQSGPRGHEPPSSREPSWPGGAQGHGMPPQHQQPQQAPTGWASHPPQPPKSSQPPPTQSAWAAQHAPAPKPPPPSSSVPPQHSWASAPPPPRGHDPMALRDVRDIFAPPPRMQAPPQMQAPYPPSTTRAPEPPPAQAPAGYHRYASTPGPGRDPRDMVGHPPPQQRSYTPVTYNDGRGYPPPGQQQQQQDMREAQAQMQREQQQQQQQQQSMLQQQLRPQDRHLYEQRPPTDKYGR